MTSSPLPRPVVMPEPFSGTEGQFKDWLQPLSCAPSLIRGKRKRGVSF
jgi:hypothetical protein